jgi:competence ComEA-like helix-hairpin-helix protein
MKKSGYPNYVKTYFTFSKGERNGIIVLVFILIILIIAIKLMPISRPNINNINYTELQKQVDSLFVKNDTSPKPSTKKYYFNTFSESKVKSFKKAAIRINSCDSSSLTTLEGIGPVFASRILKYRNLLGGYYSVNQIKEVYGMKEETFQKVKKQIIVDQGEIQLISIDTSGFKTLIRHPYIGKEIAWRIINLRKKLGGEPIKIKDIGSFQIMDTVRWIKLKPYIDFQKNTVTK